MVYDERSSKGQVGSIFSDVRATKLFEMISSIYFLDDLNRTFGFKVTDNQNK